MSSSMGVVNAQKAVNETERDRVRDVGGECAPRELSTVRTASAAAGRVPAASTTKVGGRSGPPSHLAKGKPRPCGSSKEHRGRSRARH